jgi:hypothetical protein
MSVRCDYCELRLHVHWSGREAQILNRAPRGNRDVERLTDRGHQRHPTASRHTVRPTGAALARSPQASRAHIVGSGIVDSRQLSSWRCVLSRLVFFREKAYLALCAMPSSRAPLTYTDSCTACTRPLQFVRKRPQLAVVRRHWAVKTTHQILDVSLQEDERPWVSHNPRLTTTIMILRRIAYTLLSIFKTVTQRPDQRRRDTLARPTHQNPRCPVSSHRSNLRRFAKTRTGAHTSLANRSCSNLG